MIDIIIGVAIAAGVIGVIAKGIIKMKKGESGCGCSCNKCPSSSACHHEE